MLIEFDERHGFRKDAPGTPAKFPDRFFRDLKPGGINCPDVEPGKRRNCLSAIHRNMARAGRFRECRFSPALFQAERIDCQGCHIDMQPSAGAQLLDVVGVKQRGGKCVSACQRSQGDPFGSKNYTAPISRNTEIQ